MRQVNAKAWDRFVDEHPETHLLQSSAWGSLKAGFGWQAEYLIQGDVGAQILFRSLPLGFSFAYIPKGPIGGDPEPIWEAVDHLCRQKKALFLKVEPDAWQEESQGLQWENWGFQASPNNIQPRRTITLDLTLGEDKLMAGMKQKTRYNIRLAGKKDVLIKPSNDIELFARMTAITGARDRFGVHSEDYFQRAYDLFYPLGACEFLIAYFGEEPLAALMVFAWGERAWYLYGASTSQHRNRMPAYLLQWEAVRWAMNKGCKVYDLWGVPDENEDVLEAEFMNRADDLWGVYRFKRGFGGKLQRTQPAWDKVYNRIGYEMYKLRVK